MPKTPSGKIDRRALPEPPTTRRQLDDAFVPPREGAEKHVSELWGRLLGLDIVGATDNFFDLLPGQRKKIVINSTEGHSLKDFTFRLHQLGGVR